MKTVSITGYRYKQLAQSCYAATAQTEIEPLTSLCHINVIGTDAI